MKIKTVPEEAKIIGENLKNLRIARGLNQKDLSEILDVTFQQVQKYEKGINRLPIDKLRMVKRAFNVPYELFFIGLDDDEALSNERLHWHIQRQSVNIRNQTSLLNLLSIVHMFQDYEEQGKNSLC